MKNLRKVSRRSFMTRVVGGAVVGGGAIALLGGRAEAIQITDADTGPNSDPANRTGLTDSDPSDRPGNGQGVRRSRGCTDNDSGPNSDPVGNGRGNGVTDSDSGPNSDRPGCGRGGG